ncbi:universal stress protein [Halalkalicoccus salilacus]|uniref:universal stress protein n=1 Tax=Halalkalicoccus TaxID=332246 RepID=UPI002F96B475
MGLDTLLVAVGEGDVERTDAIADAVIDVAAPAGATVVIAHVIDEETYRRALEEAGEETTTFLERRFKDRLPDQPGFEGDVPRWVERRSLADEDVRPEPVATVLDRKALIQEMVEAFEDAGVEYEIRGDVGDPAERIVAMADELDVDFVAVGGRNQSATRQRLFGSVSQEILRSVNRPVISIREGVGE